MKDIQSITGNFVHKIDSVGVNDFIYPISIEKRNGNSIETIANFSVSVSLEKQKRGIHMSRLPMLISDIASKKISTECLKNGLLKIQDVLESNDSQLDVEFDYFCDKVAPVSGYKSIMNYRCKIECLMTKTINHKKDFSMVLTVEVPITTLCPCSKEISNHSAHNQRSYVTVAIKSFSNIWIEEIVEMVESASSSELYPILKRVDEKYVTEKAYENPRFVEDIVRITADKLYNDSRISWFKIKSIHFESIHNHNAFAEIEYKE